VAPGRLGFILTTRYETPTSPNFIETPTSPTTGHAPTTDARTPPRQRVNGLIPYLQCPTLRTSSLLQPAYR
jgi:hypothetical protein